MSSSAPINELDFNAASSAEPRRPRRAVQFVVEDEAVAESSSSGLRVGVAAAIACALIGAGIYAVVTLSAPRLGPSQFETRTTGAFRVNDGLGARTKPILQSPEKEEARVPDGSGLAASPAALEAESASMSPSQAVKAETEPATSTKAGVARAIRAEPMTKPVPARARRAVIAPSEPSPPPDVALDRTPNVYPNPATTPPEVMAPTSHNDALPADPMGQSPVIQDNPY